MFKIKALLMDSYIIEQTINKKNGVVIPSSNKFLMLVEKPMQNGIIKQEIQDISVSDEIYLKYKDSVDEKIEIEVSFIEKVIFFGT